MRKIDKQEKEVIAELIKNPRISDNQIAKNTSIPLKTVNRKRKKLEEEGYLQYYTYLDTSQIGTGDFGSRQLYAITFNYGITRHDFFTKMSFSEISHIVTKHLFESHLGERDGRLVLFMVIESRLATDIIEIFNAELIPFLTKSFGTDAIYNVESYDLTHMLRLLHNYIPSMIMKKGIVKEDTSKTFVTDQTQEN